MIISSDDVSAPPEAMLTRNAKYLQEVMRKWLEVAIGHNITMANNNQNYINTDHKVKELKMRIVYGMPSNRTTLNELHATYFYLFVPQFWSMTSSNGTLTFPQLLHKCFCCCLQHRFFVQAKEFAVFALSLSYARYVAWIFHFLLPTVLRAYKIDTLFTVDLNDMISSYFCGVVGMPLQLFRLTEMRDTKKNHQNTSVQIDFSVAVSFAHWFD